MSHGQSDEVGDDGHDEDDRRPAGVWRIQLFEFNAASSDA